MAPAMRFVLGPRMAFTRFLAISGALFMGAAVCRYFGSLQATAALMVPAVVFLVCGAAGMVHFYWVAFHKTE